MWSVQINGAWQNASTDQLRELIQRGVVSRDTVVRHHSWSEPGRVGQVQAFAPFLPPAEGRTDVDVKTFDDRAAREHLTAPGLSESASAGWLPREIASLIRPAACALGLVAGLLCVAAGLYTLSSPFLAVGSESSAAVLSILKTGLGLFFCGSGLAVWGATLFAFDNARSPRR
jgi:hypothetical protein